MESDFCPICGVELKEKEREPRKSRTIYECRTCGRFIITDYIHKDDMTKSMMFYHLLHKDSDKTTVFCRDTVEEDNEYYEVVNSQTLSRLWPRTFRDRVDKTLLSFARLGEIGSSYDGNSETIKLAAWKCDDATVSFLNLLCEMGYMNQVAGLYRLTAKAWLRIDELERENRDENQGFVAMWFSEEMSEARDAIKQAILACGYTVKIIDEKEHNNQIVPELLYEIKQSRFLIADLTGHRNGVYYEAGFGEATGKQVILTCRADSFQERHFDVAQKSTIVWETAEELRDRLEKRIVATVGRA